MVAYHLAPRAVPGGFLGVDVFFVLSGFLITSLLVDEARRRGTVDLRHFYVRRARRLAPALLLVVAALALYASTWATTIELDRLRGHSLWTLGYLANWHFITDGTTYTDLVAGQSPLRHTWSLAIEEQFYLAFPLVFLLLGTVTRWRAPALRRSVAGLAVVGAVASAAWMAVVWGDGTQPSRGYFGTDTRAHQLLVGVALGALLVGRPRRTGRLVALAGWSGVVVLAGAVLVSDERSPGLQRGGFLLVALAAAGVIGAVERLGPLRTALSWRPLVGLGLISYGVYLWHWPIIVLIDAQRLGIDGVALAVVQVGLTLGLATLSFVAVERPVRRGALGHRLGRRAGWTLPVVATAVVVAVVAATTVVPPSSSARDQPSLAAATRPVASASAVAGETGSLPAAAPGRAGPAQPEPIGLVMFGDSVAHTLAGGSVGDYPRFDPWTPEQSSFDPSQVRLWSVAKPACSFLPGRATIEGHDPVDLGGFCGDWRQDLDVTLAEHSSRYVLVALSNDATDRVIDGALVRLGSAAHAALIADLLDEVRAIAGSHGAELALVVMPPPVGRFALDVDRSGQREQAMRAALTAYAADHPRVQILDLSGLLCPGGDCDRPPPGFEPAWRYDGLHYGTSGARWVARWVTHQLNR